MQTVVCDTEDSASNHEAARRAGKEAGRFIKDKQLCCSEAVLLVVNQHFGGPLTEEEAIRLGSGHCGGMAGSGCSCGALAAGITALGLFLGRCSPGAPKEKTMEKAVRTLHDTFKKEFGATCCRVLTKKFMHDKAAKAESCRKLTSFAAEQTTLLLLDARTEPLPSPRDAKKNAAETV